MRTLLIFLPVTLLAQTAGTHPATNATGTARTSSGQTTLKSSRPAGANLTTDEQKTVYAIGLFVYERSLRGLNLSAAELALVKQAITDAAQSKPAEDLNAWGPKLAPFAQQRQEAASQEVLAKAAAQAGAVKTDSGLIYRDVTPGNGPSPTAADTVRVNYRGTLPDGSEFDSSYARNQPAEFGLNGVIRCWTEGLQKMKVGGKAVLVCPASIAYGDQGHPPVIPPGTTLTFEVELLGIVNSGAPK